MMSDDAVLYHLVDLDTWEVLYVGSTAQPPYYRLQQHAGETARPEIKALFDSRRVGLEVVRSVARAERLTAERADLEAVVADGHPVVNILLRTRAGWQSLPM